ncbi:probable carboxylesterase 7 [Coffea eugenioides]|uniref:probable carboxylesterase 7 n=1 Tax=Coffea eugenioides TaxID=49369 RepID=UPI000F609B78|nr:probable carboxylesterase 7 [Coffea eugenioides]
MSVPSHSSVMFLSSSGKYLFVLSLYFGFQYGSLVKLFLVVQLEIAVKWVAPHSNGEGPEVWLRDYAGFDRVFFGGDSAGGNLAHNMASRVWREILDDFNLDVIFLNCPYFWGKDLISIELMKLQAKAYVKGIWHYVHPKFTGVDDPLLNPLMEPNLSS